MVSHHTKINRQQLFLTEPGRGKRASCAPLPRCPAQVLQTRREARRPRAADTPQSQVSPAPGRGRSRPGAAAGRVPEWGSHSTASSPPPFRSGRTQNLSAASFQGLKNKFSALSCESQPLKVAPGNSSNPAARRRESPGRRSPRGAAAAGLRPEPAARSPFVPGEGREAAGSAPAGPRSGPTGTRGWRTENLTSAKGRRGRPDLRLRPRGALPAPVLAPYLAPRLLLFVRGPAAVAAADADAAPRRSPLAVPLTRRRHRSLLSTAPLTRAHTRRRHLPLSPPKRAEEEEEGEAGPQPAPGARGAAPHHSASPRIRRRTAWPPRLPPSAEVLRAGPASPGARGAGGPRGRGEGRGSGKLGPRGAVRRKAGGTRLAASEATGAGSAGGATA
ncbi:translation initiation factor IF-2-like [Pteropus medius]|uniref:translation initiation factor IF-2-like n=1 Tax=Pteropus vampyrus TaxID=132908 RepID=UPI00196B8FF7|nr:translation initiation factor IF-2-like [Pteropus giganteus]